VEKRKDPKKREPDNRSDRILSEEVENITIGDPTAESVAADESDTVYEY